MADPTIILTTLNAKYIHAAFGLRYLLANLGPLRDQGEIIEFEIGQRTFPIVEQLLARKPKIIGFGVYIWNVTQTLSVLRCLKKLAPEIKVVLGGPEVSYEIEGQEIAQYADVLITGEADLTFAGVCREILDEGSPSQSLVRSPVPDLSEIVTPYDLYSDDDVKNRIVYVEASRGCPFTCEFCLSSLDIPVRQFPDAPFLKSLEQLYERGVQHFKFVDRTFNLNLKSSRAIMEFFLERLRPGMFLHFEMIPDRLPDGLREVIARFPPGALQFEVGIQTFDEATSKNISRRQNYQRLEDNFGFLRRETGVHIHADLIVGLPGEDIESFGRGFDRLIGLNPQEIQVGILKRLRGTPIVRHDEAWEMIYDSDPPYEILQNRLIDFQTMQRMRRFARYWDLVGNSGNFVESVSLIWDSGASPFKSFLQFSDWIYREAKRRHGIALTKLVGFVFRFLTTEVNLDPHTVAPVVWRDYQRAGRSDCPMELRPYLEKEMAEQTAPKESRSLKRQSRHLANSK
jgi:radical SAM superfamily enzyme YgiQ (UPF0313 family)